MKISNKGLSIIEQFEGCQLKAYRCPAGVLTIGYGHTGSDVKSGMIITKAEAEELLRKDVAKFEKVVSKYNDTYNWNQNQFDAMVSFAFNIGSIDQLTNKGKRSISEISAKIPAYNKAGGNVLTGLTRRRAAEKKLFDTPVEKTTTKSEIVRYKVTADFLNCRAKASAKSDSKGVFSKNTKVKLVSKANDTWFKVKGKATNSKTITGYCSSKYLTKIK